MNSQLEQLVKYTERGRQLDNRQAVIAIEDAIMKKLPQVDLPVTHYFSEGVYARKLFIPKGIILTGKIHKYSQLNIMLKGEMDVLVDDKIVNIKAPFIVVSPAGTKRIAKALQDTEWLTIHGTRETDIDKIEEQFIAQTEEEYLSFLTSEPKLPLELI